MKRKKTSKKKRKRESFKIRTWSSKSVLRVTLFFFKSILCSCNDECGMPSKSPASTTFQEPSMESSVLVEDWEEKSELREGKGEEEEVASAASVAASAAEKEEAEEEPAAAASASLSSSPGAHPLDHTTISPVSESSKQAAW